MKVVCISDTHGQLPEVPACDLLLIAGDICPHVRGGFRVGSPEDVRFQGEWLGTVFRAWLEAVPAGRVVGTWGNHDWVAERRPDLVPAGLRWEVLVDRGVEVGGVGGLTVWGSPWQPWFYDWAFNAPRGAAGEAFLAGKYGAIPEGIDVILSHGPPRGMGDLTSRGDATGSRALLDVIESRKPELVVCGHIHEAYGRYPHPSGSLVVNASVLDEEYVLVNPPVVVEL